MRTRMLCALAIPVLSLTLAAQVPPGITKVSAAGNDFPLNPALAPANCVVAGGASAGIQQIQQFETINIGTHPTSQWRVALTVVAPSSTAIGTIGGSGSVSGVYDSAAGTLTLGNDAATLNSAGSQFAFSMSNDGLVGVCDSGGGTAPFFATRASTAVPFGPVGSVTGVPATYNDSKLYEDDSGTLWYSYVDGPNISHGVINRTTGVVNASSTIIGVGSLGQLHSQEPIRDLSGAMEGWVVSNISGGAADIYFLSHKTNVGVGSDQLQLIHSNAEWKANPGQLSGSGTVNWALASSTSGYLDALEGAMVAMTGARLTAGAVNDFNCYVPHSDSPNPYLGVVLLGSAFGPIPLSLPPLTVVGNGLGTAGNRPSGMLGVLPSADFVVPIQATLGSTKVSFPVGANHPIGVPIAMQFAGFDTVQNRIVMSNTCTAVR